MCYQRWSSSRWIKRFVKRNEEFFSRINFQWLMGSFLLSHALQTQGSWGGFECERHISVLSALSLNLNSVHGLSLHTFLLQYLARDCHGEFSAGKQIKSFAAASLCNASTLIWGCSNDACGSGGMEPSANSLFETLLITISAGALMYYHNWRTHQTTTGWKGS